MLLVSIMVENYLVLKGSSSMNDNKMLAVRLPPELVDSVRDYAVNGREPIVLVVEEFIRLGLAHSHKQKPGKRRMTDEVTDEQLREQFREAKKRGEVLPWQKKKMLAVRLPPELVDSIKDYANAQEKNIALVVEEFIRLGLALKKGEEIDRQDLVSGIHAPFRKRRDSNA